MRPDDSRHGSYAGAIAHWRAGESACEPCRVAATRKRKTNELARLAGRPGIVPLGEAHRVIVSTPRNQLVEATGFTHDRLHRYEQAGPEAPVYRRTRDRILAARVVEWTPLGLQRRLQALAALGWSLNAIAQHAGMHATSLGKLRIRPTLKHVRFEFGCRVAAAYEELAMSLPPAGASATETRNEARAKGWLPPLAWDDIDDPTERPSRAREGPRRRTEVDEAVVERAMRFDFSLPMTSAERREITRRWVASGRSLRELERETGWKADRYTDGEEGAA